MHATHSFRPTLALLALLLIPRAAEAQCETGTFHASDGTGSDGFAKALAVSGRTVLVGAMLEDGVHADAGAAYVFEHDGAEFVEVAKLVPPDADSLDYFGFAVAIDGDLAVVGSKADTPIPNAGAGFVYERTPQGWTLATTLTADDARVGDVLGTSVDLEGERVVLGAPSFGDATGAVYVFERLLGVWRQTGKLTPSDPTGLRDFGNQVAMSGDRIVVGASGSPDALLVYELQGGAWTETARIEGDFSNTTHSRLLDMQGDTIVVSWTGISPGEGRAYVYELRAGSWSLAATLWPTYGGYTRFGRSVGIADGRIAVGATDASSFGSSQTFVDVFERSASSWGLLTTVVPGSIGSATDNFGSAVGISGEALVVGSSSDTGNTIYSGVAYGFTLPPTQRSYCAATTNSTGSAARLTAGCPSSPYDRLSLHVARVPDSYGLLVCSPLSVQAPFGDGFLCVGPPIFRLPLMEGHGGQMSIEVDLASHRSSGLFLPGSAWSFQALFRDPVAGGAGTNSSDGLRVLFTN